MKMRLATTLFQLVAGILFCITANAADTSQHERWTAGQLNVKSEKFNLGVYDGKIYALPNGTYDNVILIYDYYRGKTTYDPHIEIFVPAIGQTLYWSANLVDLQQASFSLSGHAIPQGDSILNGQVSRIEGAKETKPYAPHCKKQKVSRLFACRYTPNQCLPYERQTTNPSHGLIQCCQAEEKEVYGVRTGGFIDGVNMITNVKIHLSTPSGDEAELNLKGTDFKPLRENPGTCSWVWPTQD